MTDPEPTILPSGDFDELLADETHNPNERTHAAAQRLSTVVAQPPAPVLQCAACLQQAADAHALRQPIPPVHPAATIVQGMAICNVTHRIVSQATAASALLVPPRGHLPPLTGFPKTA